MRLLELDIQFQSSFYARSEAKITNKWLEAGEWHVGDKGELHKATLHLKVES